MRPDISNIGGDASPGPLGLLRPCSTASPFGVAQTRMGRSGHATARGERRCKRQRGSFGQRSYPYVQSHDYDVVVAPDHQGCPTKSMAHVDGLKKLKHADENFS